MSVVILGLGRYAEEITEIVAGISDVVIVDREGEKLRNFLDREKAVENLSVILGTATDVELWKEKIHLSEVDAVISFLSEDITIDVAKILRRVFGYTGKILFIAKERPESKELKALDIETVSVPDILGAILRNLLVGKGIVRYPVGVGLRKGELVEILITESSPVAYMRLGELRQRNAKVVLVYREGKVIFPKWDFRIQPGDRLLVAGDPSGVELFLGLATRGESNFPLKWGSVGVFCNADGGEFEYIKDKVKVREWVEGCENLGRIDDAGLVVFGKDRGGPFSKSGVDLAFESLSVPSLLCRGTFPYEDILISANTDALSFLLTTAMDVARLFRSRVFILYVSPIEKMVTKEEKERLENLKGFVDRSQRVSGLEVKLIRKEGNPVRETLKMIRGKFSLLAIGYTPGRKSRCLNPYVPHLLAKKSPVTTLLIPEVSFER